MGCYADKIAELKHLNNKRLLRVKINKILQEMVADLQQRIHPGTVAINNWAGSYKGDVDIKITVEDIQDILILLKNLPEHYLTPSTTIHALDEIVNHPLYLPEQAQLKLALNLLKKDYYQKEISRVSFAGHLREAFSFVVTMPMIGLHEFMGSLLANTLGLGFINFFNKADPQFFHEPVQVIEKGDIILSLPMLTTDYDLLETLSKRRVRDFKGTFPTVTTGSVVYADLPNKIIMPWHYAMLNLGHLLGALLILPIIVVMLPIVLLGSGLIYATGSRERQQCREALATIEQDLVAHAKNVETLNAGLRPIMVVSKQIEPEPSIFAGHGNLLLPAQPVVNPTLSSSQPEPTQSDPANPSNLPQAKK